MTRFDFYLTNAAANNNEAAKLREQTRMACIAYGMSRLGHEVSIVGLPQILGMSNRWKYFSHLMNGASKHAISVYPAETILTGNKDCDVAIKCSVKTDNDSLYIARSKLLVAHEYSDAIAEHDKLLPVPFLVHDRVIDSWCRDTVHVNLLTPIDIMQHYLDDDLEEIRSYQRLIAPAGLCACIGFAGVGHYGRDEIVAKLEAALPGMCAFRLHGSPKMFAASYMDWMSSLKAVVCPCGDTPKTNRWAEAVVLGKPIISPLQRTRVVPAQTGDNTIMPADWDDTQAILDGLERCDEIVANADVCYRQGWSPTGQAKQICLSLGLRRETTTKPIERRQKQQGDGEE